MENNIKPNVLTCKLLLCGRPNRPLYRFCLFFVCLSVCLVLASNQKNKKARKTQNARKSFSNLT